MKLTIALLASLTGVGAFVASSRSITSHHASTSTTLYQFGTLGFNTEGLYSRAEEETIRTQGEVMGYLNEVQAPTAIRSNLGTSVIISGFDPTDPASTEILAFLNNEESAHFQFTKIVAHVEDMKVAKKRLIGRNARYTGLLDKLDFTEGASSPTVEQLADVSSWVAHVGGGDMSKLSDIVDAAEAAESVKNVVILVSGAQSVGGDALKAAEELLKDKATTFAYTLLVVPEWNNEPEATCAFGIVNVTDVVDAPFEESETFSREESLRIISECLAIDNAKGKCVVANAAKEANSLENMLIVGMREMGLNRLQEIEHMVTRGAKGYNDMIATQDDGKTWEKAPELTEEEKAAKAKTNEERILLKREKRDEDAKQKELEVMATQWAKREYLRKSLKRAVSVKEADFIEVVWDRAMFEADLKYRTMKGQAVNESEERTEFREAQEKKKKEAYSAERERWDKMAYEELEPPQDKSITLGR
mmetsp:Transcript_9705/g.17231  ORF Transcript_9705/g.17231 Transcript_9705/m.17231 type:complete len:476 (-) Transcript_9705:200-1627(-)